MSEEILEFEIIPQMERYYNDDSCYGVYTFTTKDEIPKYYLCQSDPFDNDSEEVRGSCLVGNMQRLTIGLVYKVKAKLVYSSKYKQYQYVPETIISSVPQTYEQQVAFLKTQVTDLQAKNILTVYPNVVEDVINGKKIDYSKIKGIGETTWGRIKGKIIDNFVISDVLTLLQPLGVTFGVIKKLISDEYNPSILKQKLLTDPYILTKIKGLGFKKVDDLALKLNPDLRVSQKRVVAYLKYYFESLGNDTGDTWDYISNVDAAVRDNLYECYDIYADFMDREKNNSYFLHFENNKVGLHITYRKESSIIGILKELSGYSNNMNINIENGILQAEKEQGFNFTDEQKAIISKACSSNVVLISGLAGTGKTTVLRAVITIYKNYSISCCALSAKAAQRITEATNCPASTIHRLLGYNKTSFKYNAENRLESDIIVLDEASMVNVPIFLALLSAIKEGAKVIICGDDGQLPPIGYGNVFHDLLSTNTFTSCKLTKILRQAARSGIISDSAKIRSNQNPLERLELKVTTGELQDMTYMFRDNREGMRDLALKLYFETVEQGSVDDTIIVLPRKQNSINSTFEINKIIQDKLISKNEENIKYGIKEFRVGAKVIQRANNYEKNVFNGEIGYVTKIWKQSGNNIMTVDFGNNKIIDFAQSELVSIELAYALTIHLTQGSGYKNVIVLIDNTHYKLLDSCLLYTGITRAKQRCLLIAEPSAYKRCLSNKASIRNTWLSLIG